MVGLHEILADKVIICLEELCSFAIFGNFEVNKNCHFWQFLTSIFTD